jgi:hypothetical protein
VTLISEIKISVLIDCKHMELAMQALDDVFELDKARSNRDAPLFQALPSGLKQPHDPPPGPHRPGGFHFPRPCAL